MRPSWEDVQSAVKAATVRVVTSAQGVGRVEPRIFPGQVKEELYLRAAGVDDDAVSADVRYICDIVARNAAGPNRYIDTYAPFLRFLSQPAAGAASTDPSSSEESPRATAPSEAAVAVEAFLSKTPSLEKVVAYIGQLRDTRTEVASMRAVVPMELFRLDASALHKRIVENIDGLIRTLVGWVATRNVQRNESLCRRFEAITDRLTTRPTDTDAMAALEVTVISCPRSLGSIMREIWRVFILPRKYLHFNHLSCSCLFALVCSFWSSSSRCCFESSTCSNVLAHNPFAGVCQRDQDQDHLRPC
jgi:hypothetical protein